MIKKIEKLNEVLTFGKFRGFTVRSVINLEPDYMPYLIRNGIEISDKIKNYATREKPMFDIRYIYTLEAIGEKELYLNLVKQFYEPIYKNIKVINAEIIRKILVPDSIRFFIIKKSETQFILQDYDNLAIRDLFNNSLKEYLKNIENE